MTIEELGRKYKAKYGHSNKSDREIGLAVLKKHPEYSSRITTPTVDLTLSNVSNLPKWFAADQATKRKHQLEYVERTLSLENTISNANHALKYREEAYDNQIELQRLAHEKNITTEQIALDETQHAAKLAPIIHETLIEQMAEARKLGIEVTQLQLLNNERAMIPLRMTELALKNKAEEEHKKALEDIRITAYRSEIAADLEGILAQRQITHEEVMSIKKRLQDLIIERDEIERLNVSEPTKNRLLIEQDKVIEAFQETIRVKIQRHLLEGSTGEGLPPDDNASDSPSGN